MASRAVHWHEGMFLRPHHLQAAQRHAEDLASLGGAISTDVNGKIHVTLTPVINLTIGILTSADIALEDRVYLNTSRPDEFVITGDANTGYFDVVEMAARGMTNREIAAALYVTIKTVEGHLGAAYDKLGIRSRRELGAALGASTPQ